MNLKVIECVCGTRNLLMIFKHSVVQADWRFSAHVLVFKAKNINKKNFEEFYESEHCLN